MSDFSPAAASPEAENESLAKSALRNSLVRMPDGTYGIDADLFSRFDASSQAMFVDVMNEANRDAEVRRSEQAEVARRLAESLAGAAEPHGAWPAPQRTMLDALEESLTVARLQLEELHAVRAEVRALRDGWPGHG